MPLPEIEREITTLVVRRFADANVPTTRKEIMVTFKPHGPDALHRLVAFSVLRQLESDQVIPNVIAFHLCGFTESRLQAKSAFEMVVPVLQRMYEIPPETTQLTTDVLKFDLERIWPELSPIVMRLGLYQCYEMGLVSGWAWGKEMAEVQRLRVNDRIMGIDAKKYWEEYIRNESNRVELSYRKDNSLKFLRGVSDLAEGREGFNVAPLQWVELANTGISQDDRDWIVRYLVTEELVRRKPASDVLALTRKGISELQGHSAPFTLQESRWH
jgi:hypothetical protein